MKIHCLFVVREHSGPELLEAWDEYSVNENVEGWNESCQHHLNKVKESGLMSHTFLDIEVDDNELGKVLNPVLSGKISS